MKAPSILSSLILALALGATALTTRDRASRPAESDDARIAKVTAGLLEQAHYSGRKFDNEVAGQFLDRYLDMLDGQHLLLLQSDLEEFSALRTTLDELTLRKGDVSPAFDLFNQFRSRMEERAEYVKELLKTERFEFAGNDTWAPDREKEPRPRDPGEARQLWRQQLRFEYLQEKLAGKKPDEIVKILEKRHDRALHAVKQLNHDQVLEMYLTALAHVYDPHSDYMGRRQVEDFSIAMNLSLYGIGATLEADDGYCKIRELVTGGPAARSKLIKPGDRIAAVAQDGREPVDVIDMPLSDAVTLIRGPKGTKVTLTLIPAGANDTATRKTVTLVRDEVKLEDQEAKGRILDLPTPKGETLRLGVIDLPSFYSDADGHRGAPKKSATADVARLIEKLKAENVRGIVLDLRRNGGGSLEEAIGLTGLFIPHGPVVQTKDAEGRVAVERDDDPSVAYDGPLVVLTSRFSASASEIVAGALQDHGRGLIVGDSSTYGKGTVQNVMSLANVMRSAGMRSQSDPGALKLTIRKFYLPGGSSTQLKGVVPDIVLPSIFDEAKVGEAEMFNALPWDRVPAARFRPLDLVKPYLAVLKKNSNQRVATNEEFTWLREDMARFHERQANPQVSLNERTRQAEKNEADARLDTRKKERAARPPEAPVTYEINLRNAGKPGLPAPVAAGKNAASSESDPAGSEGSELDADARTTARDIAMDEAMRILADYTTLTDGGQTPEFAHHPAHLN